MSKLIAKDKDIHVPGEVLAEGMDYLPGTGTYREGEQIVSNRLGIVKIEGRAIKIIPLTGSYLPKVRDVIICKVKEILMSGWMVDTNSPYPAMLGMANATSEYIPKGADLTRYYNFGDNIVCQVVNVTSQKLVDITLKGPGLKKLYDGRILKVNSTKVPRIIGKKGSMISMIKQATNCKIIIGQNGVIWMQGEDPHSEILVVETIKKIEDESHTSGLTDRIKEFLEKKTGKKIELMFEGE